MSNESTLRQKSSVRHTCAVQRSRTMRQNAALPADQITERLTEGLHSATLSQVHTVH